MTLMGYLQCSVENQFRYDPFMGPRKESLAKGEFK
jgi:hypothetical protein